MPSAAPHLAPKKKSKGKTFLKWLLIILLIAGAAAAGWYYRDMQAKDDEKVLKAEIVSLKANNTKLKADLAAAEAAANAPDAQDTIVAAVVSGNYDSNVEQVSADKVSIIIAGTEGLGERTPAQVVSDLKYLDGGTDPWNCTLPASTIDEFQAGPYKQYFPDGATVCMSANKYVISVQIDENGKINTIFMTNNADTLK